MTAPVPAAPVRRVAVVHGYDAAPDSHWFPWLRERLAARGVQVVLVELPEPSFPEAGAWLDAVGRAVGGVDEHTHLVGHSLGCITVLRHLARLPQPWTLGGIVLVAGFTGRLESVPLLDDFLAEDVDLAAVRANTRHRLVLRSDEDPTVPAAATEELAARLGAELRVVPGAGHFCGSDGVSRLPVVLDALTRPAGS
ncbi:RBBP9/YdeN family alpha/beta hydrolase [Kocuria rosea]|jgi:predicted alpha/beta hydrolase family esterase|uniref:RBBP9/YdeN family alpha/beta hydrolase n=1 Tax=Kocuria rosea TaxID=1275 RepID=UPI00203C5B7E|nr:alpha/beta hydrolase [Kocuria rosea]MCM3688717.1 alpha/beta hydrolase [Kocuria rosea]HST72830.1 alpha/beta hydrolase [Kocuria rosea]